MSKQVMQQALKVLRGCLEHPDAADAIASIEAAIAAPEPVRGTDAQILKERELTCWAVEGAMATGFQAGEYPPDEAAWLRVFWNVGRRDAERGAEIAALKAAQPVSAKYDPRMNLIEGEKGTFTLRIDGLSMREIKSIFETQYGSLMWSEGAAYPADKVKLQFASADFSITQPAPALSMSMFASEADYKEALAKPAPAAPYQVPDGWQVAPIESDEAMLRAVTHLDYTSQTDVGWAEGYKCMIAAAPKATP